MASVISRFLLPSKKSCATTLRLRLLLRSPPISHTVMFGENLSLMTAGSVRPSRSCPEISTVQLRVVPAGCSTPPIVCDVVLIAPFLPLVNPGPSVFPVIDVLLTTAELVRWSSESGTSVVVRQVRYVK